MFEKYKGQDQYHSTVRNAIRRKETEQTWPVLEDFAFIETVALIDDDRPNEEVFVYNNEIVKSRDQDKEDGPLPRQVFVRLVLDHQSDWKKEDHVKHGHLLASKLNVELKKERTALTEQWKKDSLKDYYFDDELSWITPEEKKPLGLYVMKSVMRKRIMNHLYDKDTELTNRWAEKYPESVHEFFANGLSDAARELGVPFNYNYKDDKYYLEKFKAENDNPSQQQPIPGTIGISCATIDNATAVVTPQKKKPDDSETVGTVNSEDCSGMSTNSPPNHLSVDAWDNESDERPKAQRTLLKKRSTRSNGNGH
jgi:hypothetical protein